MSKKSVITFAFKRDRVAQNFKELKNRFIYIDVIKNDMNSITVFVLYNKKGEGGKYM